MKIFLYLAAAMVVVSGICGCQEPAQLKQQADEQVYQIIESKWQDDFGSDDDIRIADVEGASKVRVQIPADGMLTVRQAIDIAESSNRDIQTLKEELYISGLDLTLARHDFEYFFFGGAAADYSRTAGGDKSWGVEPSAGFDRLFSNGARISTRLALSWRDFLSGGLDDGFAAVFQAVGVVPLLRGSDKMVVRENLTQADRNVLYQLRSYARLRKTVSVEVITQYYSTLQAWDIWYNARENYKVLGRITEQIEILGNSGRVPQFEVEQARQDVLSAKDDMVTAERDYRQLLDEFKLLIGVEPTCEFMLDPTELAKLYDVGMPQLDIQLSDAVAASQARRLDMLNSYEQIADAARKVEVAKDALRAQLDLIGDVGGQTRRSDGLKLETLDENINLSVQADLPFDRLAERNEWRKAHINLQRSQRAWELLRDQTQAEVRDAWRRMQEATARWEIQKQSLKLAEKRLKDTTELVGVGRANTRDILDAQRDLLNAEDGATEALVDYTNASLRFFLSTGILEVRDEKLFGKEL